jgi:hypothetical protein
MRTIITAVCLSLALSACAKRPSAIAPTAIPIDGYMTRDCPTLAQNLAEERANLTQSEADQNSAANLDAFGVFLLGVPAASLIGADHAGTVSVQKGRIISIEQAMIAKSCPAAAAPMNATPPKTAPATP